MFARSGSAIRVPAAGWFRKLALPLALSASGICAQAIPALHGDGVGPRPLVAQSQDAEFATARDSHGTVYTGGSGGAFVAREGGWRVQLGTDAADSVRALGAAPDGSIYAAGMMGAGGFVAKLSPAGVLSASLKLDTPVGALAIDSDGSVYVGGNGVLARLSPSLTMEDRFATGDVTALAARGGTVWVAFRSLPGYTTPNMKVVDLGAGTHVEAMTMDPSGAIYAAGTTTAPDLPNARNHLNGPSDAFVARLNTATGGVGWSQYVGGSGAEEGTGIGWDRDGSLLVMGHTKSPDFPGEVKGGRFKAHADPPYQLGLSVMPESAAGGTDSVIVYDGTGAWSASSNASWLHTSSSGTTPGGVAVFTIDANSGAAARTGTLTIAGQTLTVEQAGTDYQKAALLYTLDTDTLLDGTPAGGGTIVNPGLAVDSSGNLFYVNNDCSGGDCSTGIQGGINEWHASTQTVTTNLVPPSGQTAPDCPGAPSGLDCGLTGVVPYTGGSALQVYAVSSESTAPAFDFFSWTSAGGVTEPGNITSNDFFGGAGIPTEMAIDSNGIVYIGDLFSPAVWIWNGSALNALSSGSTPASLQPGGNGQIQGAAVDLLNNVYVLDGTSMGIYKGTLAGGLLSSPFIHPYPTLAGTNNTFDLAVDASGNLYYIDDTENPAGIQKYSAATGTFSHFLTSTIPVSGTTTHINDPVGVVVSGAGNLVFRSNGLESSTATGIFMLPNAYIDTATVNESGDEGSDSLPAVVPSTTILTGPFLPTSDESWLTIGTPSDGVVNFTFTANTGSSRTAHINVLGQSVTVTQGEMPAVDPPTITKSFSPTTIPLNGTSTLTLTLANPNPSTALTGVNFSDNFPSGLQVANPAGIGSTCSGTWNATPGDTFLNFGGGTLPPNSSCSLTVNVTGTTAGAKLNATNAPQSNEGGTGVASNTATLTVIAPPTISKAFELVSQIAASPTGAAESGSTVTITTTSPHGFLTGQSVTIAGAGVAGYNGTFTIASVPSPTTFTYTDTNTGLAASGGGTATVPITTTPLNGTATLAFTLTNPNSGTPLTGVSFTDALPSGLQVATTPGASAPCGTFAPSSGDTTLSFSSGTLADSATCNVSVNITATTAGLKNNTTGAVTSNEGGTGGTTSASITVLSPPSISKAFGVANISPGGTTTLTFTITNPNGSNQLLGIAFTDALPSGLAVAATPGASTSCGGTFAPNAGDPTLSFSGGTVAASGTCIVAVNVTATTAGTKNNTTGNVTSTNGGMGNTASATLTVASPPTISKAFGASSIPVGGATSLTFTITNPNSAIGLTGVAFTDALPAGLTVASGTATTCGGGTLTTTPTEISLTGGTIAASGNCQFSVTVTGTTTGLKTNTTGPVTSTEGGTGTSSNTASLTVNAATTSTGVTSSSNPSVFGQSITFTATVTDTSVGSTAQPTGSVQFVVDSVNFGSPVALTGATSTTSTATSSATATLSVTGSPHTVTANYTNTDGNFVSGSGSLTPGQTVTAASTSTAVISSSNPSAFGQAVTFTATVTDTSAGSTAQPAGAVQFKVDGSPFGSPVTLTGATTTTSTANSQAIATLSVSGTGHTVEADYTNSDGNFTNSSGQLSPKQVVTLGGTTTTVTPSQGTITLGDTVTLTATVTVNSPGTGTPTGLVTFFDGATPIGGGTLNQANPDQATFSTSLLAVGSDSITAVYLGDGTFAASPLSSPVTETVNLRGTTTAVALNPTTVSTGEASTVNATVADGGASTPPGTPDVFTATGAPATGRTGFTSTLFADGLVLVAGGTGADGTTVLNSAEVYSVSSGTFSTTGNLNAARTGAVAVLLPTGKVLIAGGSSDGTANGALNTAELFDPITGTFTSSSQNMTAARFGLTATLLNTGKVLIAGGENSGGVLNSAELHDPVAGTFTATGNLNAARTGASATLLGNGKVLIAGGSSDGTAAGALNSAESFDPAGNSGAGTFTSVAGAHPTLTTGRWQPEAALLLSGMVLVAGGQNSGGPLDTADLYDPAADSFTASAHPMSETRANGSAVALPNGMILLAGGTTATTVELYDADSDKFDSTGSLNKFDTGLVSTLLNNGRVLELGLTILDPPGQPAVVSDAELYSPTFNPLGLVGGSSSDADDVFTACALTPSTSTASACNSTVTPDEIGANPHTITGTYSADAVHSGSSNSANLTVTASAPPVIAKSFGQNPVAQNGTVPVGFTIVNPNPASTLTGISFTDALPAGLVVATPNQVTNTCGGTVTAVPGSSSLSLTGGTLGPPGPPPQSLNARRGSKPRTTAAQGDCFISVALLVTGTGTISNTTGPVSANESGPGNPSNTATMEVVLAPTLSKAFGSGQVALGQGTTLTFNAANPNTSTALSNLAFSDTLPSGLVVASPSGLTGTCVSDGASISAKPGGSTISMTNLSLSASGSCSFAVNVTSSSAGVRNNVTSAVTGTFADDDGDTILITGGTASASLMVVAPPTLSKGFNPSIIAVGASSTLTFTVANPAGNGSTLHSISFSDLFPSGLAVSSTPGVGGTCVSGGNGTVTATAGATTVSYSGGVLAAGSSCTITMSVTATSSGTLTNTAGPPTATENSTSTATATAALTVLAPTYMNANTGTTPQSTPVTKAFGTLLSVTVLAADDATPVPGIVVTFTAPLSGATGTFANSTNTTQTTTNASGVATATVFTANTTEGGAYTATAAASGLTTVNFLLTNTAGPATQMSANPNTTPQSAQVANAFGVPLSVTVKDAYNNLVPGVVVTFTAPPSGASGTFTNTTHTTQATTNGSGVATASTFTAGTLAGGPYNVTATASGPPAVNFSLTNTVGPATQLLAHAGTPQSAQVTTAFGTLLAAVAEDQYDNPVSGVTVTFTAPSSGATGTFANSTNTTQATTGGNGVATATVFTANTVEGGPYTVAAAASGLATANFSLTNTAGAPTQMSANPGATPQSAQVANAFGIPLSVTVKDAYNNLVPGVVVTFTAPPSGASGTFANTTHTTQATTNGSGVATATFTAGTLAGGPYNVTATASGPPAVNFSLTNTVGPATQLLAHAGTPQSAQVTTAFGTLLAAIAEDKYNNPVSGIVVSFTAPSSGATGTFANSTNTTQATTNSSGIATATAFTANTKSGTYNVNATATGLPSAPFELTNTAGAPARISPPIGTTPQSTPVNTPFPAPLEVLLLDQYQNPVPGVTVVFTTPASGPSGTFANGMTTIQATSDSTGVASANLTANSQAGGPYLATAAVTGFSEINYTLTNLPASTLFKLASNPVEVEYCAASIPPNPPSTVQVQTPNPLAFTVMLSAQARDRIAITPASGTSPQNLTVTALPNPDARPGQYSLPYEVVFGNGSRMFGLAVLHVCGHGR
jgi:uncharacterized repeat protein (TIGR01451 family)